MARYPKAFETWYMEQLQIQRQELDDVIIRMRDNHEVDTLEEGERRIRKMMFFEWSLETGRIK